MERFPLDRNHPSEFMGRMNGALAQLGERMTGSHEVSGSIPLCSTIFSHWMTVAFFIDGENR